MTHHIPGERERARALLESPRGHYIISQALTLAIEHLETEAPEFREVSNLADMRLLRDELFPLFYIAQRGSAKWREMLDEQRQREGR
jgi:hypothetical protein